MNLREKTLTLKAMLKKWEAKPDWNLYAIYRPFRQEILKGGRRWLLCKAAHVFRNCLFRLHILKIRGWSASLEHSPLKNNKTILIWDDMPDKNSGRKACDGLNQFFLEKKNYTPTLITPKADFAFYSRLGWQIEYVPDIPGDGECYQQRKQRYLAWRYKGTPALPLSAGLASNEIIDDLVKIAAAQK